MAVPLAATLQPIEQPIELTVGAEAELVFDLAGVDPLPAADDVITVSFYTTGQVTNTFGIMASSATETRVTTENVDGVGTPVIICTVVTNFFGPPTTVTTTQYFPTRSLEYGVQSLFEWLDVASFYWWESPYPLSEDGFGGPEAPPDPLFPDADNPLVVTDYFAGRVRGTLCDPVFVAPAPAALEIVGPAPAVVATQSVFAFPAAAELEVAGPAPTVVVAENQFVSPAPAVLQLQGVAPGILLPIAVSPPPAVLELVGPAPTVGIPANAVLYAGSVVLYAGDTVTYNP